MKIDEIYNNFKTCTIASTDTRKLQQNCMYFALKGDNFDGNQFVQKAFDGGAKYCIIDNIEYKINDNCILVKDVLSTLQELATFHRKKIGIAIISLTGSNGKTTTKELINTVLKTTYKVKATVGNLNNHIGVPLTLLSFTEDLDFGIVEMGANHLNEIEFLCNIALPDYGLITNFGKAHLEGFGSVEGVVKAKSELYNYIISNKKIAFINTDDNKQIKQIGAYSKIIKFGNGEKNDCIVTFKEAKPYVTLVYNDLQIKSQLIGDYNYGNIAVAVAIGKHFKVSSENIKKGIENYQPDNNRSEIINKGTTQIILDAYNANPTSMLAALKNFKQLDAKNKYLFLGDMFELGTEAAKEHQSIVDFITLNFDENIYIIGNNFYDTNTKSSLHKFRRFEDLKELLKSLQLNNTSVLIKGSRGMALERILDTI
ncbi:MULTISPECIES: UDP-N-acetylmuramoyl-tripeptide--D-alanyl-D-alanine ligase [Winogradskyella]|uniref:UDP-N-acetylmuramoyl-tripeptide--D-alanyl-D- alanine ligase n=1 Tax=Winogradskyella TaxID=286104 RepID=UPI0015C8EDA4|nr:MULTISPECIES: UDP-N-acetylmuramoyl-tripeptide--D-alanyl-D-alanine ligase [Winogradskyella]QXP77811.1 UDP-N-acetylmuramoyl-tripeptide--D-alanyl-D-alanine ligase [Winogradskyella sp. HaHa_3_26]